MKKSLQIKRKKHLKVMNTDTRRPPRPKPPVPLGIGWSTPGGEKDHLM